MKNKTELRAAAARLLYNDNRDTSNYDMLIDFIDNYFDNQQPTTDGWIPCSERLPRKSDYYDIMANIDEQPRLVMSVFYYASKERWSRYHDNIISWREHSPQPYKEGEKHE